ncbi:MAG TPA: hypothetical protein VMG12_34365, partial [Polyangiaceae bacterium]|nr:hypothetical protein [Polyangiaceae bacterium]
MRRGLSTFACLLALARCAGQGPAVVDPSASASASAASTAPPSPPPPAIESSASSSSSNAAAVAGACWRLAESARATTPVPARLATECVPRSSAIERDVGARLAREAKDGDGGLVARVDYPCVTLREQPGAVRAVVVEGHAGYARVVGLRASGAGQFRARVLRVATGGGPNQTPPGPVEFFRTDLSEAAIVGT